MINDFMKPELNQLQRKKAKQLAHHLEPVVTVGLQGLTENVIKKTDECLLAHELIKVKFNSHKEKKRILIQTLAESTESIMVDLIGNVGILYRPNPEVKLRKISL